MTAALALQSPTALRVELRANRAVYARGAPVKLTLAITNVGPDPVSLTAPSSQLYDFTVLKGGAEVWRWSAGHLFAAVLTPLEIPAGQSREFSESWDQRGHDGQPVPPGDFLVVGILIGGPQLGLSPQQLRITIR